VSPFRIARAGRATCVALALALAATACTSSSDDAHDATADSKSVERGGSITIWTLEDVQDRIERTKAMAEAFTAAWGLEVEIVPIAEDQFDQVLTAAAADDSLPDAIAALSLAGAQSLNVNELLNTHMSADIVQSLGADTFADGALALTQVDGQQLGVPSDAWVQLLLYRTDLFEAAGLEAPASWDTLQAAATSLNAEGTAGIVLATTPGDSFTQQTFEYLALPNGCDMVDTEGAITISSDECVAAFELYNTLVTDGSVAGNQDVDSTRATYFAGQSAMVVWSSFILDELAGLRDDALPTCPECTDDPGWLAKNTGVVGVLTGAGGEGAQFGEVVSWVPTSSADPATAGFIEYMMSDSYVDWLGLAPEGKVPVRLGTAEEPTKFVDAWGSLEAGVDRTAPLSDFYGPDVIKAVLEGTQSLDRWGIPQGQGALIGATLGALPVPEQLNEMVSAGKSPKDAAGDAAASIEEIAEGL